MQHSQDFYINGQWVAPLEGRPFDVINPSNEEIAGTISLGGKADTDAAVAASKAAFTTWRRSSMSERMDLLELKGVRCFNAFEVFKNLRC